jgi:TonB family protein
MAHLVLFDPKGKVTRTFDGQKEEFLVVQDQTTGRVQIALDQAQLESLDSDYQVIKKLTADELKKSPFLIGDLGKLAFVENIESVSLDKVDLSPSEEEEKSWKFILGLTSLLFFTFMLSIKNIPRMTARMEEQLKTKVLDIRENVLKTKRPKPMVTQVRVRPKVNQTTQAPNHSKQVGIKRMGALSALGQLSGSGKQSGLNLGAVETSRGPGLGGGTLGSGGTQTNIYAKGMVSAPLGAGNNLAGAGGYGTKGRGGGQAGYGELRLAGSLGAQALPVGSGAVVAQGLDRDQISAVIARNQGQVRYCYEQGLQQDANLSGRVTVEFSIGGNGLVQEAKVSQSTIKNATVEECIVQKLKSWKFPLPDGGVTVKVSYPFTLRRAGQG